MVAFDIIWYQLTVQPVHLQPFAKWKSNVLRAEEMRCGGADLFIASPRPIPPESYVRIEPVWKRDLSHMRTAHPQSVPKWSHPRPIRRLFNRGSGGEGANLKKNKKIRGVNSVSGKKTNKKKLHYFEIICAPPPPQPLCIRACTPRQKIVSANTFSKKKK